MPPMPAMIKSRVWMKMAKSLGRLALVFSVLSAAATLVPSELGFGTQGAYAQSSGAVIRPSPGKQKSFNPFKPFIQMFGGEPRKRRTTKSTSTNRPSSAATGNAPRFVEEPKDPDAGIILVVGDRMARGVADGLTYTLADKPMVKVETLTEDNDGLSGAEGSDWTAKTLARIRGADVKAVVIMMGKEDRGKDMPRDVVVEFGSPAWLEAYGNRVGTLVKAIRAERKPVIWVGLPPTSKSGLNRDFTQFNSIFRNQVEAERGHYVDIWDIFLADSGDYSSFGPDVEGNRVRLRSADKIGFTWAGYRKVAFFVERQLSRILGGYGGLAFEGVEDDPNFIVLTGRTTSPEDELLGAGDEEKSVDVPEGDGSAYSYFVKGETLATVPGRVDDTGMSGFQGGS